MIQIELSQDDIFLLGNIAMKAIAAGLGEKTYKMSKMVRTYRPNNAGGALIDSLRFANKGQTREAIESLESNNVFSAERNREEAFIFYLTLLIHEGELTRSQRLAKDFLDSVVTMTDATETALRAIIAMNGSSEASPVIEDSNLSDAQEVS